MNVLVVTIVILVLGSLFIKKVKPLTLDWRALGALGVMAGLATIVVQLYQQEAVWLAIVSTVAALVLYVLGRVFKHPVLHAIAAFVGVFGPIGTMTLPVDIKMTLPAGVLALLLVAIVAGIGFWRARKNKPAAPKTEVTTETN